MPVETVDLEGSDRKLIYYLVVLDAAGAERVGDAEPPTSKQAADALIEDQDAITDVIVFSHGWLNDRKTARRSYRDWLRAMDNHGGPHQRPAREEFRELLVGIHWPSRPFGDERLDLPAAYGVGAAPGDPLGALATLAVTPQAHEALVTILMAAERSIDAFDPPRDLLAAYRVLDEEVGLGAEGPGGPPGADRDLLDPEVVLQVAAEELGADASYGSFGARMSDIILAFPRMLSFWHMKRMACEKVGESGGAKLLTMLHQAALHDVRFHLIGHSFGAIVVSSMLAAAARATPSLRPMQSMVLLQGAQSLWSYAAKVPARPERPGYFHSIAHDGLVAGPILTTRSRHDYVLDWPYRVGAGIARQVDFRPGAPPRYGAVGRHGLVGDGFDSKWMEMLEEHGTYSFDPGTVYNLEASKYIFERKRLDPLVGAHSHLTHPAVANAVWSALLIQPT